MENRIRRAIILVVVLAFMIPMLTPRVFAASNIAINGGENVKGGEKFTVTVVFSGDSIGRVDGQMLFDTSKLTYLSGGSSSGNTGYIQLKKAGTGGDITFSIKFQAVSGGSTNLEVTVNEMYDINESYLEPPAASKAITISGDAEEEELITEEADPDKPVKESKVMGVDEKPEEGISTMTLMIIVAAVLAVGIGIIVAVLLRKKNKETEPAAKENKRNQDIEKENFEDEDVIYDSSGNIARRSQMSKNKPSKNKTSKKKDSKDQATKKKYGNEDTELWEDWDGGDDHRMK
ncbi:MAG: hypothetical protein GX663_08570 [Clostridiales bacterium]|nr:hypothetical protein [Clostridiales bacterium]